MSAHSTSRKAPWLTIVNYVDPGEPAEILIYDQIGRDWWTGGGMASKDFAEALKEIPKDKEILVRIDSPGGNIQDGIAIFNMLEDRHDKVTTQVEGAAHSIAGVLAQAGKERRICENSQMLVHKAWFGLSGNADELEEAAKQLRFYDEIIANTFSKTTKKGKDEILAIMRGENGNGTLYNGKTAHGDGFFDTIKGATNVQNSYKLENCPPEFVKALAAAANTAPNHTETPKEPQTDSAGQQPPTAAAANSISATEEVGNANKAGVTAGKTTKERTMPENTAPAVDNTALITDLKNQLAAERKNRIQAKVNSYVDSQRITKDEAEFYTNAALLNEEQTFTALDKRQPANAGAEPVGRIEVVSENPLDKINAIKSPRARYDALKSDWNGLLTDALKRDERKNAYLRQIGAMPMNANTYSATLVTAFLTDGATTVLQNKWAALRAFSRDFSTDRYKPRAVAQHKYVSGGPTVQTNATNFESGDSTVAPITITPSQYTASINVSNADLNNGLRMENLVTIASAALANKVIEAATAPITLANFTTQLPGATNVVTAANFGFDTLGTLWGLLQKANQKMLVADGTYLAKLLNQPTYFQKTDTESEGAWKAFGWDGLFLNADWTGASDNAKVFACDPQAIAVLAGLPITPPSGIPGNTLQESSFTIPGVEMSVATYSWFNLAGRTAWMSFDCVFGASKMDTTAGVIVASA